MKRLILIAALFLTPWTGAFAQPDSISVEVLATFDYPGEGVSTSAQGINDAGDIAGSYEVDGNTFSFVRYSDGSFSEPIVEPNDADGFTFARDINNLGTLAGSYGTADGETHGFLLSGNTFSEFDAPNSVSTYIYGLNDANDLVGVSYATDVSFGMAYARIGGNTVTSILPNAKTSFAYGINNAQEVVGLYYERGNFNYHGFYRAPDGTLTAPIDAPGASTTFLSGINEKGVIVGRYGRYGRHPAWPGL